MQRRDFTDETVNAAWRRANGVCECTRTSPGHFSRCDVTLDPSNRGREGRGSWETNHRNGDPSDNSPSNCEILCWFCHSQTRDFGRPAR